MKQYERISQYRVMWIFVLFDLPTETQKDIKAYAQFRKNIMRDGFTMFQFSIYIRQCSSIENVEDNKELKGITWKRISSLSSLQGLIKVRINHIGQIIDVGEY